jgi:hypothetical protein
MVPKSDKKSASVYNNNVNIEIPSLDFVLYISLNCGKYTIL